MNNYNPTARNNTLNAPFTQGATDKKSNGLEENIADKVNLGQCIGSTQQPIYSGVQRTHFDESASRPSIKEGMSKP